MTGTINLIVNFPFHTSVLNFASLFWLMLATAVPIRLTIHLGILSVRLSRVLIRFFLHNLLLEICCIHPASSPRIRNGSRNLLAVSAQVAWLVLQVLGLHHPVVAVMTLPML